MRPGSHGLVGWVERNIILVAVLAAAVLLAALVAVPLSLGHPLGSPKTSGYAASSGVSASSSTTSSSGSASSRSSSAAMPVPSQAVSGSGTSAAAPGTPDLLGGRDIIRTARLNLQVSQVGSAFQDVLKLTAAQGGYAVTSSLTNNGDQSVGNLEVRVPAAHLSAFLAALSKLGNVASVSQSGNDVTSQVVDVNARLTVLQAEETRLLGFLKKATSVKDMLQVEQQLETTRTQIEQLQAQQKTLSTQVAMATVTVNLTQAAPTIQSASGHTSFTAELGRVLSVATDTLVYILGRALLAVVWLLPFAALAAVVYGAWRLWRRRRGPASKADR